MEIHVLRRNIRPENDRLSSNIWERIMCCESRNSGIWRMEGFRWGWRPKLRWDDCIFAGGMSVKTKPSSGSKIAWTQGGIFGLVVTYIYQPIYTTQQLMNGQGWTVTVCNANYADHIFRSKSWWIMIIIFFIIDIQYSVCYIFYKAYISIYRIESFILFILFMKTEVFWNPCF